MGSRARLVAVVAVACVSAGCASRPDYTYARRSRDERPYRGGAASVPDEEPVSRFEPDHPNPFDLLVLLGAWALMFSNNVDHSGIGPEDVPITATPR